MRGLDRRPRFPPLDRLIIDAIVDSRQGVDGALPEQELHRAVDEFVNLNGRRHQSHFHAGFRDALFDRPGDTALPAQNEMRARWYWTGAIQGWARSGAWHRIVDAYDDVGTVTALGDGADDASRMAGAHIAEALWKTDRVAELCEFVTVRLAGQPTVHRLLLDAGTETLRSRSPGVARTVFALLMEAGESVGEENPLRGRMPTVRRRMAHCLRLLGEQQGAEDLLRGLLQDEEDPGIHAMVHADLGLINGGFALLDEARIPGRETERRDVVDRLRAGEEHFRKAVANPDATYACHGHYCLGVLHLADDALGDCRFDEARRHLERAHAGIRSVRDYPASLVAQIDLYLGIAKAHSLDAAEIRQAARHVVSGLNGAELPRHFIATTVEHLALSGDGIETVVMPLLRSGSDEALDALAETTMLDSHAPLAERLRERAHRSNRPKTLAAADLRGALRGYLGVHDEGSAREVLDELEHMAVEGWEVDEFLALLDDPIRYDPAWDQEDAAVAKARCLEAAGRLGESLTTLRSVFYSSMSKPDLPNALGVLERIRTYGLDPAEYRDMRAYYDGRAHHDAVAASTDDAPTESQAGACPVTVLVVGGNEVQARSSGRVASKVQERDPKVTVDFLHTGWGGNWNQYVEEVKRLLPNTDAVVVMRYIRTHLGREVRALCGRWNKPWRPCWSGGQGGIANSVLVAAQAAREQAGA